MKLKNIRATNFKGANFSLDLTDVNFIVAPNFTGKTARADAIRFLLLGRIPELGGRPGDAFALASAREMVVEGEFDDGTKIVRRLRLKGNSVSAESQGAEVFENFSGMAAMLDADSYFELTDRERVEYVFANVKLGQSETHTAVADRLAKKLAEQHPPAAVDLVLPELARRTESVALNGTVQEFVALSIDQAAELQKAAKAEAEKMERTVQGLGQIRLTQEPASDASEFDTKIAGQNAAIADLSEKKGGLIAAWNELLRIRRRREELTRQIAGSAQTSRLDSLMAGLEAIRRERDALPITPSEAVIDQLRTTKVQATMELNDARRDWRTAHDSIAAAQRVLDELELKKTCPYCGGAGEAWKDIKRAELKLLIQQQGQVRDNFQAAGESAKGRLTAAEQAVTTAEGKKRALEALNGREQAALAQVRDAEKSMQSVHGWQAELAALPAEDQELEQKVKAVDALIATCRDYVGVLEGQKRTAASRANDLQRLAQAETMRDSARKEAEVAAAALKELREIQRDLVAGAFEPLLADANSFFGPLLTTPLAYNPERTELGTWRAGVWVTNKTLSGVEKLAAYAAIQMALASRSPCRLMILDEMLRARNTKKGRHFDILVDCCKRAVRDGRIDQFLGIIPGDPEEYASLEEKDCSIISIN